MTDDALSVPIRPDVEDRERVADMWFELGLENFGWAHLFMGIDGGSRPCNQTLRLSLSHVWDPLPDLAALAEHAYGGDLPFVIEIDSEGPESRLSISPVGNRDTAIFEVRDPWYPVVYFAAEVDPRQMGIALAHALRVAIADPERREHWDTWYSLPRSGPRHTEYFGNAWLRDLVIAEHPSKEWYYDGIDTANQTRWHD